MSARSVFVTGLARALGTHYLGDLAGGTLGRVIDAVKDHLTLDGRELAAAFQYGLSRGARAIALGLSPDGAGVLTRLSLRIRRALASKIAQVYAERIEGDFLAPYAEGQGLTQPQVQALRAAALALCRDLANRGAEVLPPEALSEADLAALARGSQSQDLAALLLDRAAEALGLLDPQVRGLLAYQGLLGDATLWFLRERLRGDDRARATLEVRQREGIIDQNTHLHHDVKQILRLMEHDPKDRPEGAEAVLELVSRLPGSPDPEPKPGPASTPPQPRPAAAPVPAADPPAQAAVVGAASPRRATPAPRAHRSFFNRHKAEPQVPDIHGWPTDKVQALQKAAAQALGRPVAFRDHFVSPRSVTEANRE